MYCSFQPQFLKRLFPFPKKVYLTTVVLKSRVAMYKNFGMQNRVSIASYAETGGSKYQRTNCYWGQHPLHGDPSRVGHVTYPSPNCYTFRTVVFPICQVKKKALPTYPSQANKMWAMGVENLPKQKEVQYSLSRDITNPAKLSLQFTIKFGSISGSSAPTTDNPRRRLWLLEEQNKDLSCSSVEGGVADWLAREFWERW